jgi:predicted dehydrogenase
MKDLTSSRRNFIRTTVLSATALGFMPSATFAIPAAGDRIRLGVIGLGRRAVSLTHNFLRVPGVQVIAGSDVYAIKRQRFEKQCNDYYASAKQKVKIKTYERYEDILSRKDIDGVVIVTPDHWHALMAIDACKAGKDVYLEKPLTLTIREGQELVKAVRSNNRILAVGSQQRSGPGFQWAVKQVREGRIGKVERINAFTGSQPPKAFDLPEEPIPQGLNWDLWLGPAPVLPFNSQLNPAITLDPPVNESIWAGWRWYKELGGGLITDWGAHMFDIAQWAIDRDSSGPVEVIPPGFQDYDHLTFRYADGIVMTDRPWDDRKSRGVKFWGTDGWIEVTRDFFRASDPAIALAAVKDETGTAHEVNFVESMRSRKDPIVPVETGHRSCTVCSLGNIAFELGRRIRWNPETETFLNDEEASRHLHRIYRDGYALS